VAKRNSFAAIPHGHALAEAIVDAVREPLLVLDPDLRVIAASRSFYRTFAVTPRKTEGRLLFELGGGEWNIPRLRKVLEDIIPKRRTVEAYEVEHEFPSIGHRVMLLNARRVFDQDGSASAILLAIEDVTRRRETEREKDELLQQKEILLQEMQHRVANSLQLSPAFSCSRRGRYNPKRLAIIYATPTSASCRWRPCKNSCTRLG
jgi:chemotaxis protein methyltransferase CheR